MKKCGEFVDFVPAEDPDRVWPVRCGKKAKWLAYNPHDGFTDAVCNKHKKELERMERDEDMEFVFNHFPHGLTNREAANWRWPWDPCLRLTPGCSVDHSKNGDEPCATY